VVAVPYVPLLDLPVLRFPNACWDGGWRRHIAFTLDFRDCVIVNSQDRLRAVSSPAPSTIDDQANQR
jgi:hypothetical protein